MYNSINFNYFINSYYVHKFILFTLTVDERRILVPMSYISWVYIIAVKEFSSQRHILRCYIRSKSSMVALQGAKIQDNGYLRIQGRVHIFHKMSQKVLITFWHERFNYLLDVLIWVLSASRYGRKKVCIEFRSQRHFVNDRFGSVTWFGLKYLWVLVQYMLKHRTFYRQQGK